MNTGAIVLINGLADNTLLLRIHIIERAVFQFITNL